MGAAGSYGNASLSKLDLCPHSLLFQSTSTNYGPTETKITSTALEFCGIQDFVFIKPSVRKLGLKMFDLFLFYFISLGFRDWTVKQEKQHFLNLLPNLPALLAPQRGDKSDKKRLFNDN